MGENIGSVARAIKNFNIKHLRIVKPRCNWPNQKAAATSVGAKDILKSAEIYSSLEESIDDLDLIFASSSRIRKVNKKIIAVSNLKAKIKKGKSWFTIGVSPNIIEASFKALIDSLDYKLYKEKAPANN